MSLKLLQTPSNLCSSYYMIHNCIFLSSHSTHWLNSMLQFLCYVCVVSEWDYVHRCHSLPVEERVVIVLAALLKNQLVENDVAARNWTWVVSRAPWVIKDRLSLQLLLFFHLERGNLNVLVTWRKSLKCRFSWQ